MDGKHVVFGHLVSGFDLLSTLENVETGEDDEPKVKCVISHCGILVKKTKKKKKKKSRKRSLSKSSASSREDKRSKLIKDVEGGELSDPEEEEDPGVMPPPETMARNWLDRSGGKRSGRRYGTVETGERTDKSGIAVKGRGRIRYQK